MYKLFNDDKQWRVFKSGQEIKSGELKEVVVYLVRQQGFQLSEVNMALEEMLSKGDDTADFGMYKSFIFTSHRKLKGVA